MHYNISFEHFLAHNLNPVQREAVTHTHGVLLVRAGAGSGKTRIITARMTYLITHAAVDPTQIVALTFTNKAAREMKERILHFLGSTTQLPYIGTFHSYCLRLLKNNPLYYNPHFSILDDDDQHKILKHLLHKHQLEKKISVRQAAHALSQIKYNKSLTHDYSLQQLYLAYEQEKKISHTLDFDDLLLHTIQLFNNHLAFKHELQQQVRHILVDEYQDTNYVQHELLKHITQHAPRALAVDSLCIVGDEDQSIYSWRGATVANILHFGQDFPETKSITIEQNYRSVQPIVEAANSVIAHNHYRQPKQLRSLRTAIDRIRSIQCASEYHEAEAITTCVKALSKTSSLASIAILYRSHYQSRALEEALIRASIPYKIIGGIQFYERQEIKDLLAYLRLIVNSFDRVAFARSINCPTRGLGDKFQELFLATWDQHTVLDFTGVAKHLITTHQLNSAKNEALLRFINLYTNLSERSPTHILEHIIDTTNYITHLKTTHSEEEAIAKIDNVKELLHAITFFEKQGKVTVADFLNEVTLMQEHQHIQDTTHTLTLMTLHAAKGLEFDTIIISGLEEGVFPSTHALHDPERLEEERRLLYVGITRAKERLLLTHAMYRSTYGNVMFQKPTRFLQEIPECYMQHHTTTQYDVVRFNAYFAQWLNGKSPDLVLGSIATPCTISPVSERHTPVHQQWQPQQKVHHAQFGIGTIEAVEQRNSETTYLTIRFAHGIKKINTTFVQ